MPNWMNTSEDRNSDRLSASGDEDRDKTNESQNEFGIYILCEGKSQTANFVIVCKISSTCGIVVRSE